MDIRQEIKEEGIQEVYTFLTPYCLSGRVLRVKSD